MTNNCKECNAVDDDNMVQCDTCDGWFHFTYVGVDSCIAEVSWSCDACEHSASARLTRPISSSSPTTNIGGTTVDRRVHFSVIEPTTSVIATANLHGNQIFTEAHAMTPGQTTQCVRRPIPVVQSTSTVSQTFPGTAAFTNPMNFVSLPISENPKTPSVINTHHNVYALGGVESMLNATGQNHSSPVSQRNLQLERLEEEFKIQQQYLENKYKILSQSSESISSNTFSLLNNGPTATQLAARQSIPKQLPMFSGDPEEWPLFISTFENSTAVAGYSDAENLIRLQACLKGKARDIVKNKLFLPSMVADIIQTLKMCFGRPEQILERAMNRARAMPPIKDKLESLIDFALCVKNICTTMEGCQMYAHLHNPLLVKELVDKLPNNQKLNWAMTPKDNAIPAVKLFSDWLYKLAEAASMVVSFTPTRDEGSAVTLIDKNLFDELGLKGTHDPICLRWTGNTTRSENESVRATIKISNATNRRTYKLNGVHTVNALDLPEQSIDAETIAKKYPHLNGLPIESYNKVKPSLLIGAENWKLAVPLKVKEGAWMQPIASKTRLGWTVQGGQNDHIFDFRLNVHYCDCQKGYLELHERVKEFFRLESPDASNLLSAEDQTAVDLMNATCRKVDGFYEIGLPWRDPNVSLPDSYSNALNRAICLKRKCARDPNLRAEIQQQINNLVSKGYAEKLSTPELHMEREKVWYLPIFVVTNPNKPGKVRLVWDAAAKAKGVSLNDFLLTGPDMLNSLFEILLAFRVGKVAICGDISEMFHRIKVRESDRHAQRFLWWDNDEESKQPNIYVMRAFGTSCAPYIAHFVRDKNASCFEEDFPRAVEAIQKHHYVDDFIDSENNEQAALELALQVKQIHASAGFNIHSWTSNSKFVLEQLRGDAAEIQGPKEWGSAAKILGLKILLQDIWRSDIGWDEPLSIDLYEKWCHWKSNIEVIKTAKIPRCNSEFLQHAKEVQLHMFVDAGENAYSAVCYFRVEHTNGISVALVAAKSKVSPLKPLSIPRLELQAALVGVRLAGAVLNVQRIPITKHYFWTDSKTVLRWLRMDPKNFKPYVMHRVGEILESTNVSQWDWVPSKENPADLATKSSVELNYKMWFSGPQFLLSQSNEWPHCKEFKGDEIDQVELKRYVLQIDRSSCDVLLVLFTCLTLRAIHMEIAHSLDTSSCVMSIRNFVARRGYPRQIFTDNGTNFKAAKKIICAEMKE
ncbi:uncharacterized protein LOC118756663, partial [Rhagoletis pomonella]|uniref:uncharacterized protein LOC118756663 n=1 Tax=Rhagoletis pomonella TaxID=28610 RepID=UPI0017836FE3